MTNIYPSLSLTGWVNNSESMIDLIFGHYLTSSYSQDYIYKGNVKSFPYTLEKYNTDLVTTDLEQAIYNDLNSLYSSLFTVNTIDVKVTDIPDSNGLQLNIYMELTDSDEKVYNLSRVLSTSDGVVTKVAKINNTGDFR